MTGPVFEDENATRSQARIEEDEDGRGRHAHAPNPATQAMVTLMAAYRIPHYRIASALKISFKTLKKHYVFELENAETMVDAEVLKAWMKLVQAGDSLTVNRYMERKFRLDDGIGAVTSALPSVQVIDNIPRTAIAPPVPDDGK